MREIDDYSYQCGVMDCFCEMVRAGVKRLALSHPMDTKQERDALLEYAQELCSRYGVQYYPEDEGLITDLFPLSMNRGKYNILFFKEEKVLEEYLSLKAEKLVFCQIGGYTAQKRRDLALRYGKLLGYTQEAIDQLIGQNAEKEP